MRGTKQPCSKVAAKTLPGPSMQHAAQGDSHPSDDLWPTGDWAHILGPGALYVIVHGQSSAACWLEPPLHQSENWAKTFSGDADYRGVTELTGVRSSTSDGVSVVTSLVEAAMLLSASADAANILPVLGSRSYVLLGFRLYSVRMCCRMMLHCFAIARCTSFDISSAQMSKLNFRVSGIRTSSVLAQLAICLKSSKRRARRRKVTELLSHGHLVRHARCLTR